MLGHVWMQTENTAHCQWEFFLEASPKGHTGWRLKGEKPDEQR